MGAATYFISLLFFTCTSMVLSLNETCTTDKDCSTISSICWLGRCVCKPYYSATVFHGVTQCNAQLGPYQNCTPADLCSKNSYCSKKGLCLCRKGFMFSQGECVKDVRYLGTPCTTNSDCKAFSSYCLNGVCECYQNYIKVLVNKTQQCRSYWSAMPGQKCTPVDDPGDATVCINGTSFCKKGYDIARGSCVKLGVPLGGQCSEDAQCSWIKNSRCVNLVCSCKYSRFRVHGNIICSGHVGSKCSSKKFECPHHAVCRGGSCHCSPGYRTRWKRCYHDPQSIHKDCRNSSDCPNARSICLGGQCSCTREYAPVNTTSGLQCSKKAWFNDSCTEIDKLVVPNSYCHQGVVLCIPHYIYIAKSYSCLKDVSVAFGKTCDANFQCVNLTKNSYCNGTCLCKSEFHYTKTSDKKSHICSKSVRLSFKCSDVFVCDVAGASCQNANCECNQGCKTLRYNICHCHWYDEGGQIGIIVVSLLIGLIMTCISVNIFNRGIKRQRNSTQSDDVVTIPSNPT